MDDLRQLADFLDFSNLSRSHPLYSVLNRNIPGFFKFDCGDAEIIAAIFLRAKAYSLLFSREHLNPHDRTDASKIKGEIIKYRITLYEITNPYYN